MEIDPDIWGMIHKDISIVWVDSELNHSLNPDEKAIINLIFDKGDPQKLRFLTREEGVKILTGSNLPLMMLGDIWALSDPENHGSLTRDRLATALRLIGWAQHGVTPNSELIGKGMYFR